MKKQEGIRDRATSTAVQHPLYRELTSHTLQALGLICELAEYLVTFRDDTEITTIVEDLRSAKYESALLELAMAYPWRQVAPPVRLHPPNPAGVADFEVSISGVPMVVEASTFPANLLSDPRLRLADIVEGVARRMLHGSKQRQRQRGKFLPNIGAVCGAGRQPTGAEFSLRRENGSPNATLFINENGDASSGWLREWAQRGGPLACIRVVPFVQLGGELQDSGKPVRPK